MAQQQDLRNLSQDDIINDLNVYYGEFEALPAQQQEPYLVLGYMNGGGANPYELMGTEIVYAVDYDHAFLKSALMHCDGCLDVLLTPEAIENAILYFEDQAWDLIEPKDIAMKVLYNDRIDSDGQKYTGSNWTDGVFSIEELIRAAE